VGCIFNSVGLIILLKLSVYGTVVDKINLQLSKIITN
jgi:hypothetical protein